MFRYAKYHITKTHGFCTENPGLGFLKSLEPHIALLKDQKSINPCSIRSLPMQKGIENLNYEELELSCLVHSMINSLYYWNSEIPNTVIPANIAKPTIKISKLLDRPPILTIVSTQFYNWDYIDYSKSFHPDNTKMMFSFSGTRDEDYFFTCANYIEYLGAPAVKSILELEDDIENPKKLRNHLITIGESLYSMKDSIKILRKNCDPEVFYFGFRNKLKGFDKGVIFEGEEPITMKLMGPSAVQSPLFKLIDAVLGISHNNPYLDFTEKFMKKQHRELINDIRKRDSSKLKEKVKQYDLQKEWNYVISECCEYRKIHTDLAVDYIIKPSNQNDAKGTGGSSLVEFLNNVIMTTKFHMIS
ncbi:hypothetical protein SteCoe_34397 [Stentor coeruleus]|uniref:Indoleamine 2,3-dioxygenase n=1 Tax=Stentor coeruleus TaxID=5963 RepID=A0A1R2AUS8_9CILI|nr:hypothetical protein SteCoe_34397 [Stentor coeruleus]